MLLNVITSYIRTWVPIAVGALLTFLAKHFHIVLSAKTGADLALLTAGLLMAGYYSLARLLEEHFPRLGWLLGKPARPNYAEIKANGTYVVTDVAEMFGDFAGPDPLAIEGADPNTPGSSTPPAPSAVTSAATGTTTEA